MAIAVFTTVLAWIAGLFLDALTGFEPIGILELRILLPIIVMGCFILHRLDKKDT